MLCQNELFFSGSIPMHPWARELKSCQRRSDLFATSLTLITTPLDIA